jgi:prepilin-type N-terminal cleavage/methylation domain-containing protein
MACGRGSRKGFNLIETITASVILSALVLAVLARTTQCLSYTHINRQYEVASAIIDKQLAMVDYIGIDDFVELGETEGDVAEYEPGYHWGASAEYQDIDNLYMVTITVSWVDRNRPRSLTVETMFDGKGTYTESEEETEAGSQTQGGGQ